MAQKQSIAMTQRSDMNNIAPFSEDTIARMIDVQMKELEVKTLELEQRKREDQHSFEYAQQNLDAQKADRHEERIKFGERLKVRYIFIVIVLVIVFVFLGFAMSTGHGELVSRLVEKVMYYGAGILSSYGYMKLKSEPREDSNN